MTISLHKSIVEFADYYDSFLIDLWGVIHDGTNLYKGVMPALTHLKSLSKNVIFFSNGPRRWYVPKEKLKTYGIDTSFYSNIITSGEVLFNYLANNDKFGKAYYYIGPEKDADLLSGLEYQRVDNIKDCEFVLLLGYVEYGAVDFGHVIQNRIPVICGNPDKYVVKMTGERWLCPGATAAVIKENGGVVEYFGKPYNNIYKAASGFLRGKTLAIGDSFETDIKGANDYGIDSCFIAGGIHHADIEKFEGSVIAELAKRYNAMPTMAMRDLR